MPAMKSLLGTLLFFFGMFGAEATEAGSPSAAAKAFIATLSSTEGADALRDFDDDDRRSSSFFPGDRAGLMLSRMDAETRKAGHAMLSTMLSPRGLAVIDAVRKREAALGEIEGDPSYRDHEKYYLAIFGRPGSSRWGIRFEGHHLSINLTLAGDRVVSVLPLSIASNPEQLAGAAPLAKPLFDIAERAIVEKDPKILEQLIGELLAVFRPDDAARVRAEISTELAGGTWRKESDELSFEGRGARLTMEIAGDAHFHITLESKSRDFGGR